ncbi:MAG: hypothetical protein Q7K35_04565 [bacterium]|nr:hypothetical protein [bacterium]
MSTTKKLSLVLLIIAIAVALWYAISLSKNQGNNKPAATENKKEAVKTITEEWATWRQDILGLEFTYPEKWGDPITGSSSIITDLSAIDIDNGSKNNYDFYKYAITIQFMHGGPEIDIYNNEYSGAENLTRQFYYPGAVNNFKELVKTDNICDYKIELKNNPDNIGAFQEKYSECSKGVKTAFFETEKFSDEKKYNYSVYSYGFKKLQNNFFNNLLATYAVKASESLNEKIEYKDFFNQELERRNGMIKLTEEDYEQDKNDFIKFVNSIKSFEPKQPPTKEFKIIKNEAPDITTIRKYYYNIAQGNLPAAYDMYLQKRVSYDDFYGWYKNTIMADPHDFKGLSAGKYELLVDFQEHNSGPQKYRVIISVDNDKIQTLLSQEIMGEEASFGDKKVFTKKRLGYKYFIFSENGKEIVIEKAEDNTEKVGGTIYFTNIEFSPRGSFLTYMVYAGMLIFSQVYDIDKNQIVLKKEYMHNYGFSNDEKYYYSCGTDKISNNASVSIYTTDNFQVKNYISEIENMGFARGLSCKYNQYTNKLEAKFSCFYSENGGETCKTEKNVEYDFNSDSFNINK